MVQLISNLLGLVWREQWALQNFFDGLGDLLVGGGARGIVATFTMMMQMFNMLATGAAVDAWGEELDLTGGTVTVSGKDEENGSWSETFDMIASDMISVDASAYDSLTPGKYEIVITAEEGGNKAEVSFEAEVLHSIGEHYVSTEGTLAVYAEQESDEIIYNLRNGDVINIVKVVNGYGFIASVDISGWVDMKYLKKTESHLHEKGDINNDGNVDKYDLSLLNSFLQQKEQLPNGVSVLTAVQLYAADVNGDGMTDLNDIREYLTIV